MLVLGSMRARPLTLSAVKNSSSFMLRRGPVVFTWGGSSRSEPARGRAGGGGGGGRGPSSALNLVTEFISNFRMFWPGERGTRVNELLAWLSGDTARLQGGAGRDCRARAPSLASFFLRFCGCFFFGSTGCT